MRKLTLIVAVVFAGGLLWGAAGLQQKGGEDETRPYEVVPRWPQRQLARSGCALGSQGGVFAESPNRALHSRKVHDGRALARAHLPTESLRISFAQQIHRGRS